MADYKPSVTFTAKQGQYSLDVGDAGAPAIIGDLLELCNMFDPTKTHTSGDPGGISASNIQTGAITDTTMGTRTIDDAIATALSDTGTVTELLSFIAKQLKALAGTSGWKATANETVNGLDTRVDAIEAIQITGINGLSGGEITLYGGSGADAHIVITVDPVTKRITITPTGTMVPAAHGSTHAPQGSDAVFPNGVAGQMLYLATSASVTWADAPIGFNDEDKMAISMGGMI